MREMKIGKNDAGQRLDRFLSKALNGLPVSLMNKYIRLKCIKLNGAKTKNDAVLKQGDVITFYIRDEFFAPEKKTEELSFLRVKESISPIYEDDNILLVDKPVGLICQPDAAETFNTLADHVKAYLYKKGEYDPDKENAFTPALCNRIDKNTQGIVIAAKNAEALRVMNEAIKERRLSKTYLCLAFGRFEKKKERIVAYHRKDAANNTVYISDTKKRDHKEIITEYEVLATSGNISLLRVGLITGRTHQIRAHLSHIGHPLVGDTKYGTAQMNKDLSFRYQALSAHSVRFSFENDSPLSYLSGKRFSTTPFFFDALGKMGFDVDKIRVLLYN